MGCIAKLIHRRQSPENTYDAAGCQCTGGYSARNPLNRRTRKKETKKLIVALSGSSTDSDVLARRHTRQLSARL